MGSSEFEFGALGKVIRAFRSLKGEIQLTKLTKIKSHKPVWVITPKGVDLVEIEEKLGLLSQDKMQLKERSYFDSHFNKKVDTFGKKMNDYQKKITAWLVLNEPVFFTIDEGTARLMFAELKLEKAST